MTTTKLAKLRLRLVCVSPPPTVHDGQRTEFGLLGKDQLLRPGVLKEDGSLAFDLDVQAQGTLDDGSPRLSGSFVHGQAGGRFLYLGWRYEVAAGLWIKRLKIPLSSITWTLIDEASRPEGVLVATVDESRAATVPIREGAWTLGLMTK